MNWTVRLAVAACVGLLVCLAGCRVMPYSEYKRLNESERASRDHIERERTMLRELARIEEERDAAFEEIASLREKLDDARRAQAEAETKAEVAKTVVRRPEGYRVETIGHSVLGSPLRIHLFDGEKPSLFVMGGIHGSEPAGAMVCDRLVTHLRNHPPMRRTIVMPRANPDGMDRGARWNVRGVDLNRNFPADNFDGTQRGGASPLSEPESRALHALLLVERPGSVVSIHQPLSVIDYDGPGAEALAQILGRRIDLPVRRLGTRPGSMGAWVGEKLGIPIITLELPRDVERGGEEAVWNAYGSPLAEAFLPDRMASGAPLIQEAR